MVGRVPLGNPPDQQTDREADHDRAEEAPAVVLDAVDATEHDGREDCDSDDGQDRRCPCPHVQRPCEMVPPWADEERTDDRRSCTDRGDHQGIEDRVRNEGFGNEHDGRKGDRSDERADIGLEEVGTHAGNITDVVTDVVRDDGRVPGVVLGDSRFDLADQVGTDISCLRVDTAADTSEQSDRGCAEADRRDDLDPFLDFHVHDLAEEPYAEAKPEQAEAGNGEAHHGSATERNGQGLGRPALGRGLGGAGVGCRGDAHADESCETRQDCTEDVCHRTPRTTPVEEDEDEDGHHDDESGDGEILTAHERHCALSDGVHQLDHAGVAR